MALALSQTATIIGSNAPASFLANGGTAPYAYSVLTGGAGGTINASTGQYRAPFVLSSDPQLAFDTIQVTDSLAATATARIQLGTPLILFCDIIQKEMGLADGRVYLWDQKLTQPKDNALYIAISVPTCKPFGNSNRLNPDGVTSTQYVAMQASLGIDIISRGPSARDRKEEIILALNSNYSRQQQAANSFYIAPLSTAFLNLSEVDGAAIPYRYRISVNMQYAVVKVKPFDYFDDFETVEVDTNP